MEDLVGGGQTSANKRKLPGFEVRTSSYALPASEPKTFLPSHPRNGGEARKAHRLRSRSGTPNQSAHRRSNADCFAEFGDADYLRSWSKFRYFLWGNALASVPSEVQKVDGRR